MKPTIPNLFIIGAMKSGTTSLHEYLDEHPDIFMSKVKEPGFFSDCVNYYPSDLQWYLDLFKNVTHEKIIGESSTHYTKQPVCAGVVEKLNQFNPDARFIYVMRNPTQRTISHYWHNVRYRKENRDMLTAIQKGEEYIAFSDYAYQLKPYLECFGKKNIFILTFEELIENPEKMYKEILEWLGVDSAFRAVNLGQSHNVLPTTFQKVKGLGILHKFRNSVLWNTISPLVPKRIKASAARMTVETSERNKDKDEVVRNYLRPIYIEKITELETLLGRDFGHWKL